MSSCDESKHYLKIKKYRINKTTYIGQQSRPSNKQSTWVSFLILQYFVSTRSRPQEEQRRRGKLSPYIQQCMHSADLVTWLRHLFQDKANINHTNHTAERNIVKTEQIALKISLLRLVAVCILKALALIICWITSRSQVPGSHAKDVFCPCSG